MIALLAMCVVVVLAVSVYLVLSRELKSVAMGVFILSHAVHLGILAMSGSPVLPDGTPLESPVLSAGTEADAGDTFGGLDRSLLYVDPLPQALILTSIVISFAITAVVLTLLVVTHRDAGTLRVERLQASDRPEPPGLA
ncbi:MAG: Na+/H+ antiporter Mnh1 subunit C [Phycisphaerales bacterium]